MAETKKTTVARKLAKARIDFQQRDIKKSGVNTYTEFTYFTLADIIPHATQVCFDNGIMVNMMFTDNNAAAFVMDLDSTDEDNSIIFTIPFERIEPIISNKGKETMNVAQRIGSSVSYMRRYLWYIVLDIVEADDVLDKHLGEPDGKPINTRSKPATPETKAEAKAKVTNVGGKASALLINSLKTKLGELIKKDETQKEFAQEIANATQGFTQMSKSDCEKFIAEVSNRLNG